MAEEKTRKKKNKQEKSEAHNWGSIFSLVLWVKNIYIYFFSLLNPNGSPPNSNSKWQTVRCQKRRDLQRRSLSPCLSVGENLTLCWILNQGMIQGTKHVQWIPHGADI